MYLHPSFYLNYFKKSSKSRFTQCTHGDVACIFCYGINVYSCTSTQFYNLTKYQQNSNVSNRSHSMIIYMYILSLCIPAPFFLSESLKFSSKSYWVHYTEIFIPIMVNARWQLRIWTKIVRGKRLSYSHD